MEGKEEMRRNDCWRERESRGGISSGRRDIGISGEGKVKKRRVEDEKGIKAPEAMADRRRRKGRRG